MILKLNYDRVEAYKEKFGLEKTYTGELLRLADVEFPPEMEEEEQPPIYDVEDMFVSDEILDDSYEMEETDTEEESEEEETID